MAGKKVPVSIIFKGLDDGVTAPLRALNQRLEAVQAPVKRLQNQFSRLGRSSGLTQLSGAVGGVGSSLVELGSAVQSTAFRLAGMGFAGYYALNKIIGGAVEANSHLFDLSERTGLSVESLQRWRFVAEQAGASAEDLDTGVTKFSKALSEARRGTGALVSILGAESPFLAQLTRLKSTESAFSMFIEQLGRVPNEADAVALSLAGLGRGAQGLINLGKMTAEERKQLMELRTEIGLLNKKQAAAFDAFGDSLGVISEMFKQIRTDIVGELLPVFTELSMKFRDFLKENRPAIVAFAREFATNLPGYLIIARDGLRELVDVGKSLVPVFQFIGENFGWVKTIAAVLGVYILGPLALAIKGLIVSLFALGKALLFTPIGQVLLGLGLLAGAIYLVMKNWDAIRERWADNAIVNILLQSIEDVAGAFRKAWEWGSKLAGLGFGRLASFFSGSGRPSGGGIATLAPSPLGAPIMTGAASPPNLSVQSSLREAGVKITFENAPRGMRTETQNKAGIPLDITTGYKMGPE